MARTRREKEALPQIMAIHAEELKTNPYCYFELAYTRATGWMVWVCDKCPDPDTMQPYQGRKIITNGQGATPEEAAKNALILYKAKSCQTPQT